MTLRLMRTPEARMTYGREPGFAHAGAHPATSSMTNKQETDEHRWNRPTYSTHMPQNMLGTTYKAGTVEFDLHAWRETILIVNGTFHKFDRVLMSTESVVARMQQRSVVKPLESTNHPGVLMFGDSP